MTDKKALGPPLRSAAVRALTYAIPALGLTYLLSGIALSKGVALLFLLLVHLIACLPLLFFYHCDRKRIGGRLKVRPVEKETSANQTRALLQPLCAFVGGAFFYFICSRLHILTPLNRVAIFSAGLFVGLLLIFILNLELLLYLVFGALTAVVSIGSFSVANVIIEMIFKRPAESGLLWLLPQSFSFAAAVLFAFFTNRKWVFNSTGHPWKEFIYFVLNRFLSSLIFEYGGLYLLVSICRMQADLAKILTAFAVVVVNYFISKCLIFKSKREQ